ncbi:MAG: hypothetical protein KC433_03585 [Anaerolineales bacterium]|nr:hypothetical protein [Anaerolineales bacterium]MCB8937010.1 hypothetical protein [Ardenticatenaceae bacterium]
MNEENPKYYRSIEIVPKRETAVNSKEAHWVYAKDRVSGRITGEFVAKQPLHVGTGQLVPPQRLGIQDAAPLVKSFYRADETLTVAGSSLKGAVRGLFEAMTYSAVAKTKARLDRRDFGESTYNARRRENKGDLDPAGRLFGAMGYQGHLRFFDCPLVEGETAVHDIPPQYQPKGDDENRRYYPHALKDHRQGTWPLEIVKPGGLFRFAIQFDNCSQIELGLLLIILGQTDPPICLKLGAGKSAGLGGVQFQHVQVIAVDPVQAYQTYEPEMQPVNIDGCVAAALTSPMLRPGDPVGRFQQELGCHHLE